MVDDASGAKRWAPQWVSIFADTPAGDLPAATTFWTSVSATSPGEPTGQHGEYLPLQPEDGERHLWLQRIDAGGPSWHPDLHVRDLSAAAMNATDAGATLLRASADLAVLTSPGGLSFCLFADDRPAHRIPAPVRRPDGHAVRVDQLSIDVPAEAYESECAFWHRVTGWPVTEGDRPEFRRLNDPAVAVRFLLQRLDEPSGPVRTHADLATDDRAAETAVQVAAGAELLTVQDSWTVLRAPGGHVYCITDRRP